MERLKKTVAVIGSFDSKGEEYEYLIQRLKLLKLTPALIDTSTLLTPKIKPDITADDVIRAAGISRKEFQEMSRSDILKSMAKGAAVVVRDLYNANLIDGAISMGGGQGAYLAAQVMRELPIGFPRILIATTVGLPGSSDVYRGLGDTLLINSVVDISGLNAILMSVLDKAAAALAGMVNSGYECHVQKNDNRFRVGISMWGVTTPCVERIRIKLEKQGIETYIFHANGIGGITLENLTREGFFDGIADVTLCELSNNEIGVYNRPIPNRLLEAGRLGLPQIVSVGGVDMVQMVKPFESLPEKYRGRKQFYHNENVMFVRSTEQECRIIGEAIAEKLNRSKGRFQIYLPLRGVSDYDRPGGPMYDPEADKALFDAIKQKIDNKQSVVEMDVHINDPAFADSIVESMVKELGEKGVERQQ